MSINLGYACINMSIDAPVNKGCIAKTFREKGSGHAIQLAKNNLESVIKILEWNNENDIKFYRMSSDMLPQMTNPEFCGNNGKTGVTMTNPEFCGNNGKTGVTMTNPEFCGDNGYAYDLKQFQPYFTRIGELADRYEQRLTFHPGQYNQIGTPNEEVFKKTVIDLKLHADILDLMNRDQNSVMVVHGGGRYDSKEKTLDRWVTNFYRLPENVQNRIVIENCEFGYNYKDMLQLSKKIHRPVVFDTHHHDCYSKAVKMLKTPDRFIDKIIKRWEKCGIKPKFHISEQAKCYTLGPEGDIIISPEQTLNKRLGAHSDYVETIPDYFFDLETDIDIMIEAKCKDLAVLKLKKKYNI